jgi:UDP-N-acetylenolpyruvoylglucosamine reductase
MSDWNATFKDLLDLMKLAQNKVKKEYQIDLVNEVQILKNN